jgi:hypothetical protein
MIHYSCDCCHRSINLENELRYVARIEVYAATESTAGDEDADDRDNLEEIQDILQRMEDSASENIGDEVYQQLRFDLCSECRQRFLKNPLARELAKQFDFSPN